MTFFFILSVATGKATAAVKLPVKAEVVFWGDEEGYWHRNRNCNDRFSDILCKISLNLFQKLITVKMKLHTGLLLKLYVEIWVDFLNNMARIVALFLSVNNVCTNVSQLTIQFYLTFNPEITELKSEGSRKRWQHQQLSGKRWL